MRKREVKTVGHGKRLEARETDQGETLSDKMHEDF